MSKPKTTYTFDEYVQLCCTVSSFKEMEALCTLLETEVKKFNEEEMLFLCDLAEARNNFLLLFANTESIINLN
ncbi:MAG: hypothetical protein ACP5N7_06375 [Candidatus Pacearchaeota archaeon]